MRELVDKHRQEFIIFGVDIGFFHDGSNNSYVWLRTNQSNHDDREVVVPASQPARQEEYPPIFLHLLVPGDIHVDEEEYHPSMILDQNTWTLIKDTHTSIMSINDRKTYQPMEIVVGFLVVLFSVYTVLLVGIIEWWGSRNAWIGFFALLISLIGAVRSYSLSQIMAYQKVTEKVNQKLLEQPKEPTMMGYLLKLETSALPFRSGERSLRYQLVRMGRNGDSPSTKLDGVTVDDFCVV